MRCGRLALALIVGLSTLTVSVASFAQGNLEPGQLSAPAEAVPSNPFRPTEIPEEPFGSPGFAEATDQNQAPTAAPIPNNSQATPNNRSSQVNRRPTPTPVSTSRNSSRNNNAFSPRLARAAPIMGDSFAPTLQFVDMFDPDGGGEFAAQFPGGGGATRAKIAENTAAFPMDRLIFNYNSFQNALESFGESTNVDRFTIGVEKTFLDSLFSVDVRFPLTAENDVENASFSRNGSEVGNLSVSLKVLLTSDEDSAIVAGMTIDTPTGGDVEASLFGDTFITLNNDAVHLAPFLGFLYLQGDLLTHQGFLQVDVPTNANGVIFSDTSSAPIAGEFLEQTLLYVDYSLSTQFYSAGRSRRDMIQRIAGLAEFHYTTTLEDSDQLVFDTTLNNNFLLSSTGNRIDVVNLTLGLDTLLSCGANVRFGTVVPITDDDDRFFDVEFQAQVNMRL